MDLYDIMQQETTNRKPPNWNSKGHLFLIAVVNAFVSGVKFAWTVMLQLLQQQMQHGLLARQCQKH